MAARVCELAQALAQTPIGPHTSGDNQRSQTGRLQRTLGLRDQRFDNRGLESEREIGTRLIVERPAHGSRASRRS